MLWNNPPREYTPECGIYHVRLSSGLLVVAHQYDNHSLDPKDDTVTVTVDLWDGRLKKFSKSFKAERYGTGAVNNFYADLEGAFGLGLLDMDLIDDASRIHFGEAAVSDPVEPYNRFVEAPTAPF